MGAATSPRALAATAGAAENSAGRGGPTGPPPMAQQGGGPPEAGAKPPKAGPPNPQPRQSHGLPFSQLMPTPTMHLKLHHADALCCDAASRPAAAAAANTNLRIELASFSPLFRPRLTVRAPVAGHGIIAHGPGLGKGKGCRRRKLFRPADVFRRKLAAPGVNPPKSSSRARCLFRRRNTTALPRTRRQEKTPPADR